jgi:protease IV
MRLYLSIDIEFFMIYDRIMAINKTTQSIEVKPKASGWLITYILFNLPKFLTGLVWLLISIMILAGVSSASKATEKATSSNNSGLEFETTTDDSKSNDKILVYKLSGAIDTGEGANLGDVTQNIYTSVVKKDFEQIKSNKDIKNVVFSIDTPGGTVYASEILGDLINDLLKSKNQEEAVFYYNQTVASGGLYASNKVKNYIYASPYGSTGSIGVVTYLPNYAGLADKVGYKQTVIKSGPSKDYGNPLRDLSPEEQAFLQGQIDKSYGDFVGIVARGRDIAPETVKSFANGYVYDNKKALELGLIDELSDTQKAIDRAAKNAKLEKYDIIEIKPKSQFFDLLGGGSLIKSFSTSIFDSEKLLKQNDFIKPGTQYYIDTLLLDQ